LMLACSFGDGTDLRRAHVGATNLDTIRPGERSSGMDRTTSGIERGGIRPDASTG
jgi:hypothetical protein